MRYGTKKELPHRDTTRMVNIGGVVIGGGNPIAIQSMTNTETSDVAATVAQILELEKAGCQIIRSTTSILFPSVVIVAVVEKPSSAVTSDAAQSSPCTAVPSAIPSAAASSGLVTDISIFSAAP